MALSRITYFAVLALTCILAGRGAFGQTPVSLAETAQRSGTQREATLLGKTITVRGVVSAPPISMPEYAHAIIQDATGAGLTLFLSPDQRQSMKPGNEIEATGVLDERAGLPVLRPASIEVLGQVPAPAPTKVALDQLTQITHLGRYITTEGYVHWVGQNAGGDVLAIGNGKTSALIFYPYAGRKREILLSGFRDGDFVRVTGVSAQYCPIPPFDRGYEVIIDSPADVTLISSSSFISPRLVTYLLLAIALILLLWWLRERNLKRQRRVLRDIMTLSEDVIAAPSMAEIARRIEAMPAQTFGAPEVEIYLHSEGSTTLDRVITEKARAPLSISIEEPIGSLRALIAVCFRNRAMLAVPNLPRSPLITDDSGSLPLSATVAPMIAQGHMVGIISLFYRQRADLNPDFQLAIQHLANQVAASLKLQDQQLMKEQLLRSEKMAAAGQLISGVSADLRVPLTGIERAANILLDQNRQQPCADLLTEIAAESRRGLELVDHLLSFSSMERRESRTIDLYALLARLVEVRRSEQSRRGISTVNQIIPAPLEVWADEGQLEQALLTVIVQAEQAAQAAPDNQIRIHSRILGARVQIAFESTAAPDAPRAGEAPPTDYFGFPVAQAILQSHGGDLRNASLERGVSRIEFELPVLAPSAAVGDLARRGDKPSRVLTALVVDPDLIAQRRIVQLMSVRGHRVVPVATAEEASDTIQRMQFDLIFCATRLSGLTWVELFQRIRRRVGVFALMTDGFDPEAVQAFANGEGIVLAKPVDERELDHALGMVEVRWAASRP